MSMWVAYCHLCSAVGFILALKGLASPTSARKGNVFGILGMVLAIVTSFFVPGMQHLPYLMLLIAIGGGIGTMLAFKIRMTAVPQLVAGFHSFVGLAAVLVAFCAFLTPEAFSIGHAGQILVANLIEMSLGLLIGALTFSGSLVAFLKLQGLITGQPLRFKGQHLFNIVLALLILLCLMVFIKYQRVEVMLAMAVGAALLGVLLIMPIGGADMPVVISMLNSYSGWSAAGIGFTLGNELLVITGALVGASGAILSYVMCKAMNRSIFNVIFGGYQSLGFAESIHTQHLGDIQQANGADAAFLMSQAKNIIVVPGYGMAVAHAQHALKELTQDLITLGARVRFAIHPVAGRMPGHMNVLLAEANISYDLVFEQSEINREFLSCDVVLVVGANDITNPAAKNNPQSPIFGMPILDVGLAKTVFFIKRSMAPGYAGVDNDLFYQANTYMIFGDAKFVLESICKNLETLKA